MNSLLQEDFPRIFEDINYILEQTRHQVFDLHECIEQVKKLLDNTPPNTKASQFYFTLWSTLVAQERLMAEIWRHQKIAENNRIRLETIERLLLMVLRRDESLAGDAIVHRILDALSSDRKKS